MKFSALAICASLACTLVSVPLVNAAAHAGGERRDATIERREARQEQRIDQGSKKGQLTSDEVTALNEQESNIKSQEASFKSGGKLTKRDARQLRESLNAASVQIRTERHNTKGHHKQGHHKHK